MDFEILRGHIGHKISCVMYGNEKISIECEDCYEVLYSISKHNEQNKQIKIIWKIEDVQEVRPDLSEVQAMNVLKNAKENHNANLGINWDVLRSFADTLYPIS